MAKKAKVVPLRARTPPRSPAANLLKATLQDIRPAIWRRIRVASDLTLRELHHVLQIAFGWTDSHLHELEIDGKRYGMPDPLDDIGEPPLAEHNYPLNELLHKEVTPSTSTTLATIGDTRSSLRMKSLRSAVH